jgi:uncharacterized membrane protein YcaP (DUF421 family)
MESIFQIDWKSVFVPTESLAEIVLRGSVIYIMLFALLRLLRREAGLISITDLLVVVLIADAAQNAMAAEYKSVTEGAVLVGTIAMWDYGLDWLGYRFKFFERLLRPEPLPLIKNGKMMRRNMRQELITEDELMSQLRQQGIEDILQVKKCCLEGDGRVSVIKYQQGDDQPKNDKKAV